MTGPQLIDSIRKLVVELSDENARLGDANAALKRHTTTLEFNYAHMEGDISALRGKVAALTQELATARAFSKNLSKEKHALFKAMCTPHPN